MRKVRDYDAELKALGDKAKALKARKVEQLGQLVALTGADVLDFETLAGVLLDAVTASDTATQEVWRAKGVDFFQSRGRKSGKTAPGDIIAAATATDNDAAGGSSSETQR
jgi:hypothetical protein